MGTIQNSMNQMIGSLAGAATLGKHISNQNKELAVKKVEAEKEVYNANAALEDNTDAIVDKEIAEKGYDNAEVDPDKILENNKNEALKTYKEAQDELVRREDLKLQDPSFQNNMAWGKANKRLEKANEALQEAQAAIDARANLKFDLESATKKVDTLKSNTLLDKVGNFRKNKFTGGNK